MMALVTGQAPPFALPRSKQQTSPPAGLLSGLPSSLASAAKTGYDVASRHWDKSHKTDQPTFKVYKLPPMVSQKIFRDSLPVSRAACHQAVEAMGRNARNYSHQQWYTWYAQDEYGADLFDQELKLKPLPSDNVIQDVAKFSEEYPSVCVRELCVDAL